MSAGFTPGLNLRNADDRAIFRQRVESEYAMMKLPALRSEAGLNSKATRYECIRAIANDRIEAATKRATVDCPTCSKRWDANDYKDAEFIRRLANEHMDRCAISRRDAGISA